MTAAKAVVFLLQGSIFLTVFSLGLQATFQDAASLLRNPKLLLRPVVAMNVIMPVFAAILAAVFRLPPAVKVALVLLAVSPLPPVLPRQQLKLGGSASYVYGLLVTMTLLAIIIVPLTIALFSAIFQVKATAHPVMVTKVVVITILLPLALGMLVRRLAPGFAQRGGPVLEKVALAILVLAAVPLVIAAWRPMLELIGNGTLASFAAFVLVGVIVGDLLGGPDPTNRTTLGLATASRHPGLAIAIATASFPGQYRLIAAAILLYMLLKTVVLIPYNTWSKRRSAVLKSQSPQEGRRAA